MQICGGDRLKTGNCIRFERAGFGKYFSTLAASALYVAGKYTRNTISNFTIYYKFLEIVLFARQA